MVMSGLEMLPPFPSPLVWCVKMISIFHSISSYCYVSCTLQAATFDYKLLYAFARAVSDEVRAKVSKWQV